MKAITIRHPWPWAICYLGKKVENRTWFPSLRQLAPGEDLAIHAGKMPSKSEIAEALTWMESVGLLDGVPMSKIPNLAQLRTQESSIVCVCRYDGVVVKSASRWFVGPCGLALENTRVLAQPVHIDRGALGLWEVPPPAKVLIDYQLRNWSSHG